ncbi:hypothetical protein DICSQDRAFT_135794 [Dichomitus squalens LYAD-421 SS1]|uniref:Uncharacterized protein n=1 Tax=Dichomitus squalens (strain LYAD-421) TaxID=732165 RepID=R7T2X2_DICSQ|nr:uncharacterized protein DICSQDRAFT_135794 [Dichomitus squalens LYAD-421 SS1]EJF62202.1 hypothetical protein DICSQDRAFT_135794 [Dichomitus squalens LYAD-421 SS1]
MGQNWYIVNVDRRETGLGGGAKLGEFFFDDMRDLYDSLRYPYLPKDVDKWLSRGSFALQPGPLGKLSRELLDTIFEALLEVTEDDESPPLFHLVLLSVTCKMLLSVGKSHILRQLISIHARAANCRLVCIGEYADGEEQAPPGMLTAAESEEIATTPQEWEEDDGEDGPDAATRESRTFAVFAINGYDQVTELLGEFNQFHTHLSCEISTAHWELKAAPDPQRTLELKMIWKLVGLDTYRPIYPGGPNILCNLSKSEFVREDTLVKLMRGWHRVTLAHALLSRICWSTEPGISMMCGEKYRDSLVQGPWAGDRFRIVSADSMPAPKVGTDWKDVTKDVNRLLRHLWRHEMEDDTVHSDDDEENKEGNEESGEDGEESRQEGEESGEEGGEGDC